MLDYKVTSFETPDYNRKVVVKVEAKDFSILCSAHLWYDERYGMPKFVLDAGGAYSINLCPVWAYLPNPPNKILEEAKMTLPF